MFWFFFNKYLQVVIDIVPQWSYCGLVYDKRLFDQIIIIYRKKYQKHALLMLGDFLMF